MKGIQLPKKNIFFSDMHNKEYVKNNQKFCRVRFAGIWKIKCKTGLQLTG